MIVMQTAPLVKSILYGTLFSVVAGMIYIVLLHEPGPLFYPFAALFFLCGPLVAGITGARRSPGNGCRVFLVAAGAVFGAAVVLFFITYAVLPHFDRTSVLLPESCSGFSGNSPSMPVPGYELPGAGTGILVAGSEETAVAAVIDRSHAPYPSTVFIVNRSDSRVLRQMNFPDDTIIAAVDSGIVYLYNDKIGYLIDSRTGNPVERYLVIDNYGGLSAGDRPILPGASERRRNLETSAVISSWSRDGTVRSRPRIVMNAIAYNCYVRGETGGITPI